MYLKKQRINYVQVFPKAIVASQKVYFGDQYVASIEGYANAIIDNTPKNKEYWSLRYFAAESYKDFLRKLTKVII